MFNHIIFQHLFYGPKIRKQPGWSAASAEKISMKQKKQLHTRKTWVCRQQKLLKLKYLHEIGLFVSDWSIYLLILCIVTLAISPKAKCNGFYFRPVCRP